MPGILLLLFAILMSGAYALALKPANNRCVTMSDMLLCSGCFTCVAAVCSLISGLIGGSVRMPWGGILTAFVFGVFFSLCVFLNMKALEEGPVSLTILIINFSLVFQLVYSFLFLNESITVFRVVGILLLFVCMFLFSNPKVTGEKISAKWLLYSIGSMVLNGLISIIAKVYAIETDNAYSFPFLMWGYVFATLTSFVLAFCFRVRLPEDRRVPFGKFFVPAMIVCILVVGLSNFGLNLSVLLLATMMDGAIVYPAIQGGGPIFAAIGSRLLFHEQISWKKALAILLGALAIVLLNF